MANTELHGCILQCLAALLSKHIKRVESEYWKALAIFSLLLTQLERRCLDCVGLLYVPAQDVLSYPENN